MSDQPINDYLTGIIDTLAPEGSGLRVTISRYGNGYVAELINDEGHTELYRGAATPTGTLAMLEQAILEGARA